jgi:hypothetical protein
VVVKVLRMDGMVRAVWVAILSDFKQHLDDMVDGWRMENQLTLDLKNCLL